MRSGWPALGVVIALMAANATSACGDEDRRQKSDKGASSSGAGAEGGTAGAGQGAGGGGSDDPSGKSCANAAPITALNTAVTLAGEPFDMTSGNPGSCGASSGAWFSFTASQPGCYVIAGDNGNALPVAQAVFEGTQCEPLGAEIQCLTQVTSLRNTEVYLGSGEGCLIVVSSQALWNPRATVSFVTDDPGRACQTAYDLGSETFPFVLGGAFPCDSHTAGSCASYAVGDAGWFKYVPTITGPHTITAQTIGGCNMFCDTTLAVFEGDSCAPLGSEIDCVNNPSSGSASTTVTLTQGVSYLIEFSIDDDAPAAIDDLQIEITF